MAVIERTLPVGRRKHMGGNNGRYTGKHWTAIPSSITGTEWWMGYETDNDTRVTSEHVTDGINPIITPPSTLLHDAANDLNEWMQVPSIKNTLRELGLTVPMVLSPWQLTIRGVRCNGPLGALEHDGASSYDDMMKRNQSVSNTLQDIIWSLRDMFYNDADAVSMRVGYAPVRLLGWWRKCLTDEMEWLSTGGGRIDSIQTTDYEDHVAPPRYDAHDLTEHGIKRICSTACILHGKPLTRADAMVQQVFNTAKHEAMVADSRFDKDEWAYWTGDHGMLHKPVSPLSATTGNGEGIRVQDGTNAQGLVPLVVRHDRKTAYNEVYTQALCSSLDAMLMKGPFNAELVGIDFEMTGLDPTAEWVINAGWASISINDVRSRVHDCTSRSYGVGATRSIVGNKTRNISGIDTDDVASYLPLEGDDEAQAELLELVTVHPVVVHNALNEDRFLEQCVAGYAEAKRDGLVRMVDSRLISKWVDDYVGKTSNKLEDYARHWHVLGEDGHEAHNGMDDAILMLETLNVHLHSVQAEWYEAMYHSE